MREDATVASSLTIPAVQAVADLPEAVLSAPEVDRAVKAGELRVEQTPAPAPAPEPDAPTGRKAKTDKTNGGDR